jgi:CRP-like cAMP-binding protein
VYEDLPEKIRRDLPALAGAARPFERGTTMFTTGADSRFVAFIRFGVVKVVVEDGHGHRLIAGICGPGEIVGEMGVVSNTPRSASVIGVRAGSAYFVERERFLRWRRANPVVSDLVIRTLQRRTTEADAHRLAAAALRGPERILALLRAWADKCGQDVPDGVSVRGFSQPDLALATGMSVATVERTVRELKARRLLSVGPLEFVLHDRPPRPPSDDG